MSSSELCTEASSPESQFNIGIKMIVSAYETQTTLLSNEITRLTEELEKRNEKIKKMDELCASLLKSKSEYEVKISSLTQLNKSLQFQIDTLNTENSNLKQVKETIRATIDNDKVSFDQKIPQDNKVRYLNSGGSIYQDYRNNNKNSRQKMYKCSPSSSSLMMKNERNNFLNCSSKQSLTYSSNIKKPSFSASSSFYGGLLVNNSNYSTNPNKKNKRPLSQNNRSDFFKKCRNVMGQSEYTDVMEIVKLFNNKQISKEETYEQINELLHKGNYDELINEFNKLFT